MTNLYANSSVSSVARLLISATLVLTTITTMAQTTTSATSPAASALKVYAAGSLREPFTAIASSFEEKTGIKVALTFGASGLLRERIEKGEAAAVFASADTQHPETLFGSSTGWIKPSRLVSNKLCALASPAVKLTSANLLEVMLNPAMRLGTSTPKADPSGDYAWELFRRAEVISPGAYAALDAKALKLTGSSSTPQPPPGRGTYAWLMDEGRADVFLTYCTNAISASKEVPRLTVVTIPPALEVGAVYGVTAKTGDAAAAQFVQYLLAPTGQAVFAGFGFGAP